MKEIGLIIWILLLFQIALQAQCDVDYEETLEKYCSGIYLIHQELDNKNAAEAILVLQGGNSYNIYLLNPSQSFADFFLLSDSIDISGEFDIIEKGKAARYQITVQQTREFRFSFLTKTDLRYEL